MLILEMRYNNENDTAIISVSPLPPFPHPQSVLYDNLIVFRLITLFTHACNWAKYETISIINVFLMLCYVELWLRIFQSTPREPHRSRWDRLTVSGHRETISVRSSFRCKSHFHFTKRSGSPTTVQMEHSLISLLHHSLNICKCNAHCHSHQIN